MQNQILPIHNMEQRHAGLTQPIAGSYTEALRVCLDRHHSPPVSFEITETGQSRISADVDWQVTDEVTRGAWNNDTDTTEAGAYACVLAAVELVCGLVAVSRAETKTGTDYYIAPIDVSDDDLENTFRLEVSGTNKGTASALRRRLREKLDQAARGESNLPAMAGVVGFRVRLVLIENLEES